MTSEPHNPDHSTGRPFEVDGPWRLLDLLQEIQQRVVKSPENLTSAQDLLRQSLITFAESGKSNLSAGEILDVVLECLGPGRAISMSGESLTETLKRHKTHGIPDTDTKCQEFRVGGAWYKFVPEFGVPLEGRQESAGTWSFGIEGGSLPFRGRGRSREEAQDDWRYVMHSRFQQLVRKRPFRMTEEEKADWAILSELIDVEHYWKTTPFRHLETGWISSVGSGVWEITWLGVEEVESIDADNIPDEFAGYQKDQWFEALVERDRESFALRKIIYCREIDPIEEMSDDEMKAWFSSLPTTETLPESDTDWNTL